MSESRNLANVQVAAHVTLYVILAGFAGGLVIAAVVILCCKLCLKKKKCFTRQHVVFTRSSGTNGSWSRHFRSFEREGSVETTACTSPNSILLIQDYHHDGAAEAAARTWAHDAARAAGNSSPELLEDGVLKITIEGVVEVTSLRRRSSGGGIQRQASICLSDGDESPGHATPAHVAAIVHASCTGELYPRPMGRSASSQDIATEGWSEAPLREAESTEEGLLEQHLQKHQQAHLQRAAEDRNGPLVRYNDIGSREEIGGHVAPTPPQQPPAKDDSHDLWNLRATFEDDDSESDESGDSKPTSPSPSAADRRQNFQQIVANRVNEGETSQESSLDSTDTSRGTASFESTTTDSESQTSKLQQMKADSGYKSLESRRSQANSLDIEPPPFEKQPHITVPPIFEKTPMFNRLFRAPRSDRILLRDFSIDEKSDHLFREFSRLELEKSNRRHRYRLSRDPDSPRLGISPECSIEEEGEEDQRQCLPTIE